MRWLPPATRRPYNQRVQGTYIWLGPEVAWSIGVGILIGGLLGNVRRWLREKKLTVTVFERVVAAYGIALVLLPIPFFVAFPLMAPVFVGGSVLQSRGKVAGPMWSKYALVIGAVVVCVGGFFFLLWMFGSTRFTLQSDKVVSYDAGDTMVAPRDGLEVHALSSRWRWLMGQSWSWTTFGSNHELGPHVSGSDYYWGPDGLVRGDDLGQRLAAWAGTEPEYSTRD